jgi:hypothetical protein
LIGPKPKEYSPKIEDYVSLFFSLARRGASKAKILAKDIG